MVGGRRRLLGQQPRKSLIRFGGLLKDPDCLTNPGDVKFSEEKRP